MSMYERLPFRPVVDTEVDRLVADRPLATLISSDADRTIATPIPLVLERDTDGERVLIGHLARRNPQYEMLKRNAHAVAVFTGAQGYIASSWLSRRHFAPTWNYEFAQFDLEVMIVETPEGIRNALDMLIAHVEAPYPRPWSSAEMGPRFDHLAQHIVAFRARVLDVRAQFKLGQGEPPDVIKDTHTALAQYGHLELAAAMRRQERLAAAGVD